MIVDGNKIAKEILDTLSDDIARSKISPQLAVIMAGNDHVSKHFVRVKTKIAKSVGIQIDLHSFPETLSTKEIIDVLESLRNDRKTHAIVVQLPLPSTIDTSSVLSAIDPAKDVDVLSPIAYQHFLTGTSPILPPVVGAIAEIVKKHTLSLSGLQAVVVGRGRLVGRPVSAWLRSEGAFVSEVDEATTDIGRELIEADVIISGAGVPHFIKPEMLKDDVVLFDAGTSDAKGEISGDIDSACEEKAALFTPVPGGIGPITIAILLQNVLLLKEVQD